MATEVVAQLTKAADAVAGWLPCSLGELMLPAQAFRHSVGSMFGQPTP